MALQPIFAVVDYEDDYVQPLLLSILRQILPLELLKIIAGTSELPSTSSRSLQWRQYESIDFEHLMANSETSVANSYIIRKALIRKHYLSATVSHWLTKHPDSILRNHVKPSIEFEVDYAEFLDDALIEAFELKESWARNEEVGPSQDKEWWILKPGMSDRGQGIRLFSSETELQEIFENWDPPSDDDDDEDEDEDAAATSPSSSPPAAEDPNKSLHRLSKGESSSGVITSHLRHFVAQPYISDPLLLPSPHPSSNRKFHIRTYVLASGALKVHVYRPMLALFAAKPYHDPTSSSSSSSESSSSPNEDLSSHLTNTCLQNGDREGSVHAFWSLPVEIPGMNSDEQDWREKVFAQICVVTGEMFEAAARSMSVHFQPLPNAFEIFGLDFLVDAKGCAWLLEVNAFPDFAQTGGELRDLIRGLFEDVVEVGVKPFFGLDSQIGEGGGGDRMVKVLDIDLGRR